MVLAKLAEIDELRELFQGHTHSYLTGKGAGHNNTVAETTPPLNTDDSEPPPPPPTPVADAGRDVGRPTEGGRHKALKD